MVNAQRQSSNTSMLVLEPDARNVSAARRFVADAIRNGRGGSTNNAELLTSEVVSNAVRHARTSVTVLVRRAGHRARVVVVDHSGRPPLLKPLTTDGESGRGMAIVAALADRWGVVPVHDGKVVWFEVDCPISN